MPELPEVETIARTLSPQIVGRKLDDFHILAPKSFAAGQDLLSELAGANIDSVKRRAKLLMLELTTIENATILVAFHLKMTGRVMVYPEKTSPGKHTKIIMDMAPSKNKGREHIFFDDMRTFGYCRVMRPENLKDWPFWRELGPEPLELAPQQIAELFSPLKSRIKAALLDQHVIAGIGNIYADESLFRAGIRPDTRANSISNDKLVALGKSLQEILQESIAACGSSIRDYRDANGNAGAFQNTFYVYGRGGEACRNCQSILQATRVAGRGTVFCPECQK